MKNRVINHHAAGELILSCLGRHVDTSADQLEREFTQAKEAFIATRSDESRYELICLSLARQKSADSLTYAMELIDDMQHIEAMPNADIRGLSVLLSHFNALQEKRLAEVERAQSEINELKSQLEELKGIERIINERKNDR